MKSNLSRTQRDYEAREDASRIAAGNLLEAARANERQARRYAGDDAYDAQRRACLSLARDQRRLWAAGGRP